MSEFKKHFSAFAWLIVTNLALTTAATAAPTSTIPVNFFGPWYPWENTALNNCNDEDISVAGKHREEMTLVEDAQGGFHRVCIGLISSPCTPLVRRMRLPGRAPLATATETYQCCPVTVCTPWK